MSSQAGLVPVIKFLDALGFDGLFRHHVGHSRASNAIYQLADAVFLVMVGLIGGARSLGQCSVLWSDIATQCRKWIDAESTVKTAF